MIDRYGEPLQRVPIDAGFGCPNRDEDGGGGCLFCAEDGGRAVQTRRAGEWRDQIDTAVKFARDRYGAEKFMGYCQAYSGTFASYDEQSEFYRNVLDYRSFDAFSIGTRPDCLPPQTIELFQELASKTDLWVELGVQTFNDATLLRVNRGHGRDCSIEAVEKLHDAGINCAVHLIFGLPGEVDADYHESAAVASNLPISGIKFHNLHIIRNTQLAKEYFKKPFTLLDEHDYAEAVIDAIRMMPPDIPIMRLQTDTLKENLIAPHWLMKKGQFADYLQLQMKKRGFRQGDCWKLEAGS
jgi:radical SAM protein (TIGR01212 family)